MTETIKFGLDVTHYEIDLNGEHAEDPWGHLERYVKAARKVTGLPAEDECQMQRQVALRVSGVR